MVIEGDDGGVGRWLGNGRRVYSVMPEIGDGHGLGMGGFVEEEK